MPRINPEGQITRAERLATVVAIAGAVLVHIVILLGLGRLSRWTQEGQRKERLMVIHRVRDATPLTDVVPAPQRQRLAPGPTGEEGVAPAEKKAAPSPEPEVHEPGPKPPKENELSPEMERDLREEKQEEAAGAELDASTLSVVTDLPAASFSLDGASQHRGSGTFWIRKGVPPGLYTVTFNPVAGFAAPPVQTKKLVTNGQIVFVGKYRRSTEIVVESNMPAARVTVFRPDGRPIELTCPARVLLEDLPPGSYTAVFKEMPGRLTPAPVSKNLVPGGNLYFFGEYREPPREAGQKIVAEESVAAVKAGGRAAGGPAGGAARGSGRGDGTGSGGRGTRKPTAAPPPAQDAGFDRRVDMVVRSYPSTEIEQNHRQIPYPEVIIQKSDFQKGWCQVYLIVNVNENGDVERISIERPPREARAQFEALIRAVETAVRSWDYDTISAEVHVDVRFYVE